MPEPRNRGAAMRTVGPFVPLGLALLMNTAVLPTGGGGTTSAASPTTLSAVKCEEVENMRDCHTHYPTGCSVGGQYDAYLNLLKNQLPPHAAAAATRYFHGLQDYADLERNTPPKLQKGNHIDFKDQLAALGEGQTRGLIGYLYYVTQTGAESTNCLLAGDDDVDFHIGIGFDEALAGKVRQKRRLTAADAKAVKQTSVIVEMTPHYRAYYQANWTIEAVKAALGQEVRVVGQLIIDNEHNNATQNCGFPGADTMKCWRASAWELHPVTHFQVCRSGRCEENSADWVELEEAPAEAKPLSALDTARRSP